MSEEAPVPQDSAPMLVLASDERRFIAAFIDGLVIIGLFFVVVNVAGLAHLHAWGHFIILGALWVLIEVPPVAARGRTIGHLVTGTRVVAADLSEPPGWLRAFLRWVVLVPSFFANRFRRAKAQDGWSRTDVIFIPHGLKAQVSAVGEGYDFEWIVDPRFRDRARRLEQLARERPRRYRARVALIASGGYAFLFLLAAVQLGGAAAIAAAATWGHSWGLGPITAVIGLIGYFAMTISSLRVDRSLPPGTVLTPELAPRLFDLVHDLRTRLSAPRVHVLVIDSSANAGVLQQPRFGLFGPYRNVLLVGLPLLQALSVEELKAVLAHELAHLQRRHGRLAAWIYCLRQAYPRLLDRFEHEGWPSIVATLFFERYTPYFDLSSLALARAHEYEADQLAAEIVGPAVVGAALLRLDLLHRFLDRQLPVEGATSDAETAAGRASSEDASEGDEFETHPRDTKRLRALGVEPTPLPPAVGSAASVLLPADLEAAIEAGEPPGPRARGRAHTHPVQ